VVMEERRLRTESNPIGRMIEQFVMAAYTAHPYKQPVVGYMSDLMAFSREDAEAFYREHYVPGEHGHRDRRDVTAKEIVPLGRPLFRPLEKPSEAATAAHRRGPSRSPSGWSSFRIAPSRSTVEGYHRPDVYHPDDAVTPQWPTSLERAGPRVCTQPGARHNRSRPGSAAFSGSPARSTRAYDLLWRVPPRGDNDQNRDAIRARSTRSRGRADHRRRAEDGQDPRQGEPESAPRRQPGPGDPLACGQARLRRLARDFRAVEKIDAVTKEESCASPRRLRPAQSHGRHPREFRPGVELGKERDMKASSYRVRRRADRGGSRPQVAAQVKDRKEIKYPKLPPFPDCQAVVSSSRTD